MPLKSTISCCEGVARKLSLVEIPIPNHSIPNSLEIVVRSYKIGSGAEHQPPTIMVHFCSNRTFLMHLKSLTSCTGVAMELRVGENTRPPLKQSMGNGSVVGTSGVWGKAPTADDFGAFFV